MKNYSNEIAEIEVQLTEIARQRLELRQATEARLKQVFDDRFSIFTGCTINVNNTTASFSINNEEGKSKEIFSISFYERYKEARKLDLSYYSTSTQSDFEMNRLIMLGNAARILKENSERVLQEVESALSKDREREDELYNLSNSLERKIREYRNAQLEDQKVQIELLLRGEGVEFSKFVALELKRNYVPLVSLVKIIEVSKSGKTCTVVFTTASRSQSREERCDTQSIIDQVTSRSKDIVKEELLPL